MGGLSGLFPVEELTGSKIVAWLNDRRFLLGIPSDSSVTLSALGEPSVHYETRDTGDEEAGAIYSVQIYYNGLPFSDRIIKVIASSGADAIRGLYNPFRVTSLGGLSSGYDSNDAVSIVENEVGGLSNVNTELVAADLEELLTATAGYATSYWFVRGLDSNGEWRIAFVDSDNGTLKYVSAGQHGFALPTTHRAYSQDTGNWNGFGAILYSSNSSGVTTFACQSEPECTDPAREESHLQSVEQGLGGLGYTVALSEIVPATVNHWYNYSTSGLHPDVPLTSQSFVCNPGTCFRIPMLPALDNSGADLTIVVSSGRFDTNGDPNKPSLLAWQQGSTIGLGRRKNQIDLFGHEYGHRIQSSIARSNASAGNAPFAYAYNEAMMDAHGEITEGIAARTELGFSAVSDWQLNASELWECGTPKDPDDVCAQAQPYASVDVVVMWTSTIANCSNTVWTRRSIGSALYKSWGRLVTGLGSSAVYADWDFYYAGWATNVLRSHYLTRANFPRLSDFYAATVARSGSEGAVLLFERWLRLELENLRSASQACML